MNRLEGWAFLSLIGCLVALVVSLTLLSGAAMIVGTVASVMLGILAGGLYGASVRSKG